MTGPEFRAALKSLGLRQQTLAEALGVHKSTMSQWANGHAAVPRYAALCVSLIQQLAAEGIAADITRSDLR